MAFAAQVAHSALDQRFDYEPLLAAHPIPGSLPERTFGRKKMGAPIWVSSMTGGTGRARTINHNLARACGEFGLGMGLGSCRALLENNDRLEDFDVRDLVGDDQPLYANLGIAQLEQLQANGQQDKAERLVDTLRADGLIVHVNPFQEWLQPEGDRFKRPPIAVIEKLLETFDRSVIVKEVGQGMGPASLKALLQLPLTAVEFAAGGGTNFAKLELLRSDPVRQGIYEALGNIGHSAEAMVRQVNALHEELGDRIRCEQLIISGGVKTFLDGYYLTERSSLAAIYGQAAPFLRHATGDYETLRTFVETQVRGLELATAYLAVRK